jgi:predicted TIM-barrel fold metal-dependent hydrolase
MIIDCHCHIYPEKIVAKAVESIGKFYDIPMRNDGRLETLISESEKNGITHNIIFSVATKPAQVRSINKFIAGSVAANPKRFIGLGTLHPDSDDVIGEVEEIISLGLKGVKLHPDIQGIALDDSRCDKIYRAIEGKLPLLIHAGDKRYDFSNPNRIKPILEKYPRLTVIAAHLGGYSIWEDAARELAPYPNLFVDSSSSLAMLPSEKAKEIIRAYGASRVLFATDFPMWPISEEMERFNALGLTEEEKEQIFYKNAIKVFDLKNI